MGVHGPYTCEQPHLEAIQDSPSLGEDRVLSENELEKMPEYLRGSMKWPKPGMERHLLNWKRYYAAGVRRHDEKINHFLRQLRQRGILDNSVVLYTADHGEEFLDHGGWAHGQSLFSELTRVPLFISFPKGEKRKDDQEEGRPSVSTCMRHSTV